MKILITGATGFVGRNLIEFLLSKENEIDCIVRGGTSYSFLKNKKIKIIKGDLTSKDSLKLKEYDVVYHLAGAVGSKGYGKYHEINFLGTKNLIESLKEAKKFVYLSSASAFGNYAEIIDETMESSPSSDYGKSKRDSELFLLEQKRFPTIILRPPIVYGEYDTVKKDLSMLKLIKAVKEDNYFTFNNSGRTRKSICYVKNLMNALELAGTKKNEGVYFISDSSLSLDELAERIADIEGVKLKKRDFDLETVNNFALLNEKFLGESTDFNRRVVNGMLTNWTCNSSKIERELRWKPEYNLTQSLKKTILWYKEQGILK